MTTIVYNFNLTNKTYAQASAKLMNLRDFEYIIAVDETRNFTAAAQKCFISQPTLSTQIKKLEEFLNVSIFDRTNHEIMPTPVGHEIISVARKIIGEAGQIKQIAQASNSIKDHNVILGAFPTLANYVFTEYTFQLKQHMPDLNLRLIEEKTDNLIELLVSSKLDIALLALPVQDERLSYELLFEDEFFLAVDPNHHLAKKSIIDIDCLQYEKLMLLDEGHCLRSQVIKLCGTTNYVNEDDFRAAGLETLRMMVKNGLGITLMPSVAISPEEPDIVYIPIHSKPYRKIALCWRKDSPKQDFFKSLSQLINYKPMQ